MSGMSFHYTAFLGTAASDTINVMIHKNAYELKKDISFETNLGGRTLAFRTTWGLFSPEEIDEGTRLLIEHLDISDGMSALDLGCGYGPIGVAIAAQSPSGNVHMVDKDFIAVEYAAKNAAENGLRNCTAYLSNGFSLVPKMRFDLIVSNIPAKVGRELLWIWLEDAKDHLKPGGELWVVTINGLREFMKRNFHDAFGNYEKVKQGRSYTVARAKAA
jgi:16S rRNA G1207 methylase RsmC